MNNPMLNFLQQKNKRQIVSEYLLRVGIFFLAFVFLSSVILIFLFFPSFFFSKFKNDAVNNQLESTKQQNVEKGDDPMTFVKNINKLSTLFSGDAVSQTTYGSVISKIISLKNKDIKISSISITKNATGTKEVLINGVANTRDSLTLFENDIKTDGFFNSVNFPLSDFIKDSNSEFSATLIL